jgi:hypothetical protein
MAPGHPEWKPGVKQWLEPGTVIEHPRSYMLVRMGVADAADDEAEKAANMTNTQKQQAKVAYERVSRGIAPEDYEAFDDGEIMGYNPDGSPIPGPNADFDEEDDD